VYDDGIAVLLSKIGLYGLAEGEQEVETGRVVVLPAVLLHLKFKSIYIVVELGVVVGTSAQVVHLVVGRVLERQELRHVLYGVAVHGLQSRSGEGHHDYPRRYVGQVQIELVVFEPLFLS